VARSGGGLGNLRNLLRWSLAGAAAAAAAGVVIVAAPDIRALLPERHIEFDVAPQSAEAAAPTLPVFPPLTVAAEFGNLRSEPSTTAPIVARLERGTVIVATERRSNWVRASSPDGAASGWIHISLLDGPLPSTN
jgi:SH3-like domain-containing protein